MMMRLYLTVLFLTVVRLTYAQPCNCAGSLDSLRTYIEKNYAGIKDKLTPTTQTAYRHHNKKYGDLANEVKNEAHCLFVLHKWIGFFKDHHIQVSPNLSVGTISDLVASWETINLSQTGIKNSGMTDPFSIEGIYNTADTAYKVALVKNENKLRSYAAVIVASKVPEWKENEVKFELIPAGEKKFDVIWYNRAHQPSFGQLDFTSRNDLPRMGWLKEGHRENAGTEKKSFFAEEKNNIVYFRQLNNSTGYLRIQSFNGSYARLIDSVLNTNKQKISVNPYLIIDLRNNGGGSDFSYRSIRPLIYTQPVVNIGVDLFATDDNIMAWEALLKEEKLPADTKDYISALIEKAKANKGKMLNIYNDGVDTLQQVLTYPEKVAVIINAGCASTTEQFLLEAVQSKKVTLLGEHSQGVLDYANMRNKHFFCPGYVLRYATTRSRRLNKDQGIDNTGIQPHVRIDLSTDNWLEKVTDYLSQKN